jgi:hypothetical protein
MAARSRGRGKSLKKAGEGRRRFLRHVPCLAFVIALSLCLSTCGLEVVSYYGDPGFAYVGNAFTVTHNTANTENFLGYDVYYHAYQTETLADTARATIESAISSSSSTPESVLTKMTSAGFVKIYNALTPTVSPTPLCKVSTTSSAVKFTFTMDSSTTNWYYNSTDASLSGQTIEVVRGLGTTTDSSFNDSYLASNSDYSYSTAAVTSGGTVYLVFFAIAYGYDISSLSSIYSFPTSLYQTISYTIP